MNDDTRSTQSPAGWIAIAVALFFALLMGAFYYLAYLPQAEALRAATAEAVAAGAEVQSATADARRLEQDNATLRSQLADLEDLLSELRQTSAQLENQVRQREEELAATRSTQDALIVALQSEIETGVIQIARMRDRLRVDVVNEILFDSGEAGLKEDGMDVLRRVGAVLSEVADKVILVEGHTDDVTIGGALAQRYPTNWELSAARAVNVVRFLQDEAGIDPARLAASGYSQYRPRADNTSVEGRRQNRRIEIVLAPLPEPVAADVVAGAGVPAE